MKKVLLLATLSLGLGACTVTVRPGASVSVSQANIIQRFAPDRGEGSNYSVGESVRFELNTRVAGYVTLVSLDPNGNGNVLARNVFVPAGTTIFPRAEDRVTFDIQPPRGLQRVRAIFTTARPTSSISFSGTYSRGEWTTTTEAYLRPYGANERDVIVTFFYRR